MLVSHLCPTNSLLAPRQQPAVRRLGPFKSSAAHSSERVLNAALMIGGDTVMISDTVPGSGIGRDSNIRVVLDYDDVDEMIRAFGAMAEGGEVTMELHQAFWGATFGVLADRFGIKWMFQGPAKPD
ncbi:VOC family protein [Pseudenhygromyxa sp. WMMC2535]|uniref:VOC family protein n=1 Tax=Pseudenhygromyxa sp. WMMC2535 TaxID=2712867 RepID=UPI00159522D5|nr:VOC family protein [Pseudenhygromyxa sp. WMMC2535]NVB36661.1 VOC family protein [Pseudenhygromyxa sp. WMMC2535]